MWRPGAIQVMAAVERNRLRCNVTAAPRKPRHKRRRPFALLDDRDVSVAARSIALP
jgi:hypothetical protein